MKYEYIQEKNNLGNQILHLITCGEKTLSFLYLAVPYEFSTSAYADILGKGVLVLGQTQDTPDGNFDETQSFSGRMAQFGMWDRVLSQSEISEMAGAVLLSFYYRLQYSFSCEIATTLLKFKYSHSLQLTCHREPVLI